MEIKFKELLLVLIIASLSNNVFSQGSWSIKYLPLDSLNEYYIGREIRIDFKSSENDTLLNNYGPLAIRYKLLYKKDTIKISLGQKTFPFIEEWVLYDDDVSLDYQTLKCISNSAKYRKSYIREMFLVSMNNLYITLDIYLYFGNSSKMEKYAVTIHKSTIKGLLIND